MTGQEAYEIIRLRIPLTKVRGCLDYGRFFVFSLVPLSINDEKLYFGGTVMDAVDKKTGRMFKYDISEDISAYNRAKKVNIQTIFDLPIE